MAKFTRHRHKSLSYTCLYIMSGKESYAHYALGSLLHRQDIRYNGMRLMVRKGMMIANNDK